MKKSFILFVVAMVATLTVWAQVPQTLTYQAVVRDGNGRLICNSNVGVRISILQGSETGVAVYSDQQTVRTNANGLFTLLIGTAENSIGGIDWAAGPYYLKSEIDPIGGSNYTLATVQQMFSVPYALRAHTVDSIIGGVNYNETDPVFNAWDKDYNDLINRPTIPTMVSELTNDAGYLTFFTESQILSISNDTIFLTGGSFVKLPAGFSGDYNDLTNKPTIPTVPTNVSELANDAGYLTSYTETDPVFTAWDKDYNDLINKPTIPTVPTNVSAFTNDAGYITSANVPTNVSELTNDAGYLTSFTESQILSIGHDTIFLTGGSYVKLPAGFSGDYNDLTNKPTIPTVSTNVSELTNDAGYLTSYTETDPVFTAWDKDYNDLTNKPTIPTVPTNVSEFTNDAGYLTSYTETDPVFTAWDKDYNDLINKPTIPTVPTNVSAFNNDAGYLTSYTEVQSLGDVTAIGNAANSQLKEVSDPTEDLDAVNLRTLNVTINDVIADWTHRFDSITHRYDSIIHNVDSIIHYQDSVIDTLSSLLAELGATTGDTTAVECDRFSWYGTEYTVSGDYQHHLTNVAGFDSILTMHLTINHGSHNAESQTACDSYTWHGNDYTSSGNYTYTYNNVSGCASVDTLHLTINNSTHNTVTRTACDKYVWHSTTYTAGGNYTYTYTNASGCASTDTLHLTIKQGTHNSVTQTATGSYTWHGTTYSASGNYTYSYTNSNGCASVDTLHLTIIAPFDANGASIALFSVSSTKKVHFSKGNLQYTTTGTHAVSGGGTEAGTWRFAEHQYDYIGEDNANISSSYTGWIDLFGWGTSGWNSGANAYQPWATSQEGRDYWPGGIYYINLWDEYAKADWGVYNAISNGGNQPGMWRVLSETGWSYLLFTRNASPVGDTANARFAKATVNGINGLILFPDTFTLPEGLTVTDVNYRISSPYSSNTYTDSQWSQLETAGCIFLPAAGERYGMDGTGLHSIGNLGIYWTSKSYDETWAYYMDFNGVGTGAGVSVNPLTRRGNGLSIRLVKNAE